MRSLAAGCLVLCAVACGSSLPARFVIEQDTGSYRFRRYQKSLDVEVPVEGNAAVAHMATYVKRGRSLSVAPVTVTEYARAEGLGESIRGVLRALPGYGYGVEKHEGEWLWALTGEQEDDWLLWLSGRRLVKMGVPEGESAVPPALLGAYLAQYPSDLDEQGKGTE